MHMIAIVIAENLPRNEGQFGCHVRRESRAAKKATEPTGFVADVARRPRMEVQALPENSPPITTDTNPNIMPHGVYFPGFSSLARLPLLRDWFVRRRLAHYLSPRGGGLHFGRFQTFAEAQAWLPKSSGFDNEAFSDEYVQVRTQRVFAFDYPVMFWLREAFGSGARSVFDIGGSVAVHYYAYQKFMTFPPEVTWRVCELPVTCCLGRELAAREGASAVEFTDSMDTSMVSADVWMAAGVLEFLEHTRLEDLLKCAARPPRHVLLNKLPLYRGEQFVSTQNADGDHFVPHYVFNRERYIAAIEACGYRLVDSWDVPERVYQDPSQPDRDFDAYSGLYFRRI